MAETAELDGLAEVETTPDLYGAEPDMDTDTDTGLLELAPLAMLVELPYGIVLDMPELDMVEVALAAVPLLEPLVKGAVPTLVELGLAAAVVEETLKLALLVLTEAPAELVAEVALELEAELEAELVVDGFALVELELGAGGAGALTMLLIIVLMVAWLCSCCGGAQPSSKGKRSWDHQ